MVFTYTTLLLQESSKRKGERRLVSKVATDENWNLTYLEKDMYTVYVLLKPPRIHFYLIIIIRMIR